MRMRTLPVRLASPSRPSSPWSLVMSMRGSSGSACSSSSRRGSGGGSLRQSRSSPARRAPRARRPASAGNEPSRAARVSGRRLHRHDYNCRATRRSDFPRPPLSDPRRDDPRLDLLRHWLEPGLGWRDVSLAPASADASFRRYFRVSGRRRRLGHRHGRAARQGGRRAVPAVAACSRPSASTRPACSRATRPTASCCSPTWARRPTSRNWRTPARAEAALSPTRLRRWCGSRHAGGTMPRALPPYDERLLRFEMSLFTDWLLGASPRARTRRRRVAGPLGSASTRWWPMPSGSRRCSCTATTIRATSWSAQAHNPGILDFQDAVHGAAHLRPRLAAARLLRGLAAGAGRALGARLPARRRSAAGLDGGRGRRRSSCAGST